MSQATSTNALEVLEADTIFKYDEAQHRRLCDDKPWKRDPHYFKYVKISATALIKMVMHARSGGTLEVMGMLQGKIIKETMIVVDAFALPVEGTETRVNAGAEAFEYMVQYMEHSQKAGKKENALGWYHSHPGYGCWLSGIDVNTQLMNQQYQEPWLAIVIDPVRTASSGKVTLGAFRTYPANYTPPNAGPSQYQIIPLAKIEDFGVHANAYYSLDVSYFKSSLDGALLDLLWNKYWVNTLSSTPARTNIDFMTGQIQDISEKLEQSDTTLAKKPREDKSEKSQLSQTATDASRLLRVEAHGLMSQVMKEIMFNQLKSYEEIKGTSASTSDHAHSHSH